VEIVYLLPAQTAAPPKPFRIGEAGCVWVGADGSLERDTRVRLSANSTHALLGHGVVAALNELPLEGRLGDGCETLIPPASLDRARLLFQEADRKTYGASYEFVVATQRDPAPVEYRVRIDNREYQGCLAELTYLASTASREGMAVWMQI
jgi:hypothetical protein